MRRLLGFVAGIYLVGQLFWAPQGSAERFEVLSTEMDRGVKLNVHFERDSEQQVGDVTPAEVLDVMEEVYVLLTEELGYSDWSSEKYKTIELYLLDSNEADEFDGNAYQSSTMGFTPRFMVVRDTKKHNRTPVIIIPKHYREFLGRWKKMNGQKEPIKKNIQKELAGSIIHEMTHAVLYGYHENLGSTVGGNKAGDWYTEGLARYYETKMGSFVGFTDAGFRRLYGNTMRFSRGGANYFLKFHDENIFSLRYENALFWLYFEKIYGAGCILDLTRQLAKTGDEVGPRGYMRMIQKATGLPFYRVLVDYHNWVYLEYYRQTEEGKGLMSPSRLQSTWENRAQGFESSLDDMQPLTFQIHSIKLAPALRPKAIRVRSIGFSEHSCIYAYLKSDGKTIVREYHVTTDEDIEIGGLPEGIKSIDLVVSNLDDRHAHRYEIQVI